MKTSEIKFTVKLDENNLPIGIDWEASDANEKSSCKSMMIALWDAKEKNTLRIDLWTKDMMVDEMKQFYHQNMLSATDTLSRATGETEIANEIKTFFKMIGEKMDVLSKK